MIEGIFGLIFIVGVYAFSALSDRANIDRSPSNLVRTDADRDINNATRDSRAKLRHKIEARVRKLNEDNPGRMFYRDGPHIKERTPGEIKAISECARLNARHHPYYPHYYVQGEEVIYAEHDVLIYKFESRMREINRDPNNNIQCTFDRATMRLINTSTGEEIPFDPDNYELPVRLAHAQIEE